MSIARWNLKEAGSKALARRTEIAYEVCKLDERAKKLKVRYLYGSLYIDAAGISVKVRVHYPGRSATLPRATVTERWREEVAEVS